VAEVAPTVRRRSWSSKRWRDCGERRDPTAKSSTASRTAVVVAVAGAACRHRVVDDVAIAAADAAAGHTPGTRRVSGAK